MDAEPPPRKPGYESLRRHRWSAAGVEYFVTFTVKRPANGFADDSMLHALTLTRETLESEEHWAVRTWVVMPDHLHVLFTLGERSSLSECLRLFKGRLSPSLRKTGLHWQDGYFEHRMRSYEDRLPVFLYIFLNPYRANLLPISEKWAGFYCASEDWNWFRPLTNSDVPFPTWLE